MFLYKIVHYYFQFSFLLTSFQSLIMDGIFWLYFIIMTAAPVTTNLPCQSHPTGWYKKCICNITDYNIKINNYFNNFSCVKKKQL